MGGAKDPSLKMEEAPDPYIIRPWAKFNAVPLGGDSTPDRSSPPLYEVELTASDEDDDASVLELVIPMHSRYQRVPTSSPKKSNSRAPRLFCTLFCCLRK